MSFHCKYFIRILHLMLCILFAVASAFAGVSRAIQDQYKRDYENKAMFLKIPIYSEKQLISISGQSFRIDPVTGSPRYKVGDQLRVLVVDFAGDEIKLKMGGISAPGMVELCFRFDSSLQEQFPNRDIFNRALQSTLTEGLKYTEIEEAKSTYIEEQFDRSVREIAGSASISRDSVLKSIASHVPAYQDAQRDIETYKGRLQDVSGQLSQAQSENRKLESETKSQQAEQARLKSAYAALQEKIDASASQVTKLGEELRDAKGTTQGYQKELVSLQRSLNLKVDAGRDLSIQIADLGQAMRKLQKENEALSTQISSLRTNLEAQQAANARLLGDKEELKASNKKIQSMIELLSSKGNSLQKRYVDLQNAKEKLDDFAQSVGFLRTRISEERIDDGVYYGTALVYLRNVLLGSVDWSLPTYLSHNESKSAQAAFSAESIDYVRMTPEERHVLRSFGERLKIRFALVSSSATMTVDPGKGLPIHEIGERDRSTWQWRIYNQGTQDSRLLLTARLINSNANEISLLQQEQPLVSSNAVRQIRSYLQPIPLVIGVILGFLLFGIVGIFRRHKTHHDLHPKAPSDPAQFIGKKQL
jgi:predicted nuclease with TOPRIM domain